MSEPERPIAHRSDDQLGRIRFVERLVDALVSRRTRRSTGIVIGVTGPWGSGKSSVLNMLVGELRERFPSTLVVRFEPWLISNRDDLVLRFIDELQKAIRSRHGGTDWSKAATSLFEYGKLLAPVVGASNPTLGTLFERLASSAHTPKTIDESKRSLEFSLSRIRTPIVVVIDELDRVEDSEVKAIAQLVRSVVNFPQISYVLAYDYDRVVQALGGDAASEERIERGRSYIEKIVQLSIPIPIASPDEMRGLVSSEVNKLVNEGLIEGGIGPGDRLDKIIDVSIPKVINTPRDIKRVMGMYQVLLGMVEGEVNAADLLGYSILLAKRPHSISALRDDPEAYVADPLSLSEHAVRVDKRYDKRSLPARDVLDEKAKKIFDFLFDTDGAEQNAALGSLSISRRRGLLTVLRLGLYPGEVPKHEAEDAILGSETYVTSMLESYLEDGQLADLMDRISDIYPSHSVLPPTGFWLGAAKFISVADVRSPERFLIKRNVVDDFYTLLMRGGMSLQQKDASKNILEKLREEGEQNIWTTSLRRHFFVYGLFGRRNDGGDRAIFSQKEVEEIAQSEVTRIKRELTSGLLVKKLVGLSAIFIINDLELWDGSCKSSLWSALQDDEGIDRIALLSFGGNNVIEDETINALIGIEYFRNRVRFRLAGLGVRDPENYENTLDNLDVAANTRPLVDALVRAYQGHRRV